MMHSLSIIDLWFENLNDLISTFLQERLPGDMHHYDSFDSAIQDCAFDRLAINAADMDIENIYRKTPPGLPPHRLSLKCGAVVMLIRNISVRDGLCNGTRVMIEELGVNDFFSNSSLCYLSGKHIGMQTFKSRKKGSAIHPLSLSLYFWRGSKENKK